MVGRWSEAEWVLELGIVWGRDSRFWRLVLVLRVEAGRMTGGRVVVGRTEEDPMPTSPCQPALHHPSLLHSAPSLTTQSGKKPSLQT